MTTSFDKTIVTCAVTGAETTRSQNPNLPISPSEIAESAAEACRTGAAICHLHVRNPDGSPTQSYEIFKETISLIRQKCDAVIELSTGGAIGMTLEERLSPLSLKPEMASLDCGTINFGDTYFVNTIPMMKECALRMKQNGVFPTFECFDLSHFDMVGVLAEKMEIGSPLHYGIVAHCPGAMSYQPSHLEYLVKQVGLNSYFTAISTGGKNSVPVMKQALDLNGFLRVGMEDNVWLGKGKPAASNAELVDQAVNLIKKAGKQPASPKDVRKLFNLNNP